MHVRRLLSGQVGTADARDDEGVQRGDGTVFAEAVHTQRAAGIVGDSEKVTIRGDVAGVLAVFRQACRL